MTNAVHEFILTLQGGVNHKLYLPGHNLWIFFIKVRPLINQSMKFELRFRPYTGLKGDDGISRKYFVTITEGEKKIMFVDENKLKLEFSHVRKLGPTTMTFTLRVSPYTDTNLKRGG